MQPSVVKNFISRETCFIINNYFSNKAKPDPNGFLSVPFTGQNGTVGYWRNDGLEGFFYSDIIKILVEAIAHQFNISKNKIKLNRVNYQLMTEGQEIGYHSDNRGAYEGQMKHVGKSALLYLNDDYLGGEILFYDKDNNGAEFFTKYKPEPGTLIYFTGDENHPHSVDKVISGKRANIVLFYDVNES
jgi:hypothetical protein